MSKTLDKLIKDINKAYEDKGLLPPVCDAKPIDFISTGFKSLNSALGGGWARGKIIELWGTHSCGKTTLALQSIAEAQKNGLKCVFIDVERALNPKYAETLGVDMKELIYVKPDYAEQSMEIAYQFADTGEVSLIVLDSVASLLPKDVADRTMEQQEQAKLARVLSRNIPKLIPVLDNNKCSFIFINQIRLEVGKMFGNPEITPGGNVLKYGAFMRVEVRHIEFIKDKDELVGDMVRALVKKTKSSEPFKQVMLRMDYGHGFNSGYDTLQAQIADGTITKSGAWYVFNKENDLKIQGEDNAIRHITNPTEVSKSE